MRDIPDQAAEILRDGDLCYLAAPSPTGPHVTPVVFVLDGGRIWGTTARRTTKGRLWRSNGRAGGLVRVGERAVSFRGPVTLYDALDPFTWPVSVLQSPVVARASARFTLKNARFFAGYARDAGRVPLSWTPPGRVVFSVDLEAGAVLETDRVRDRWGNWEGSVAGRTSFRAVRRKLPRGPMPEEVRPLLATRGRGIVGIDGRSGPVVLPAVWTRSGGVCYAAIPRQVLGLAGAGPRAPGALVIDRASSWRASKMRGVLLRGDAEVYVPAELRSGAGSLRGRLARIDVPDDPAVVRLVPRTIVWWNGWASGTVGRP